MSLLDKASLIVTPNAYKESKLYSVVPNTTLGDMDVVRATTATRVNSAGLIEVVPKNLLQQSNGFNVGPWVNSGVTLTSGFTDVNGGNKAFRFQCPATTSFIYNLASATTGAQYTHSVYVRAVSGTQTIKVEDAYAGGAVNTTVTTEWQRITLTFTATVNEVGILIYNNPSTAVDVYICFAQSEQGSTATEYFPTTTRLNIPRIDYTNGSCPSLLVEPQRTNVALYSEQFDNAYWDKFNTSITANNAVAPNGTTSADRLVLTGTSSDSRSLYKTAPIVTTTNTITLSTFVKYVDKQYIQLVFSGGFSTDFANFDLINGTVTNGTYVNANIKSYANGWYRISITTIGLNTFCLPFIWAIDTGLASRAANSTSTGTSAYLIWGAQIEDGSYATSYITTVASSVTRNADVISKTNSFIAGKTVACLFIDFKKDYFSNFTGIIGYRNATTCDFYMLAFQNSTDVEFRALSQNGKSVTIVHPISLGRNKIALYRENNKLSLFVNGVKVAENTAVLPMNEFDSSPQTLRLNTDPIFGNFEQQLYINSAQIYTTQLTDAECIALTTL